MKLEIKFNFYRIGIIKDQILKFSLWRCVFNTSLTGTDHKLEWETSALSDSTVDKVNSLSTSNVGTDAEFQITVKLDSHGYSVDDQLTFKGVEGTNGIEADLSSSGTFTLGEIVYQKM